MLNIVSGKVDRPQKVVIYGPEGIGKTTLASCFPNPLFIDTENGTAHMDVRRISITSFEELLSVIAEVAATPNVCKTLVVDTADWAEQRCVAAICEKYKKSGIEDFGYGKGYTYVAEDFGRFLAALDKLIDAGIHVVVNAHAKMRKFENPDEMGAYDRWEMKLTKQCAPLLKEWSDLLLFCSYKVHVITAPNDTKKVQGGKRVMYTTHHPCWDAKNRHNLPEEMDLSYDGIRHIFDPAVPQDTTGAVKQPLSALAKVKAKMDEAKILPEELQQVVADKGYYTKDKTIEDYSEDFLTQWVIPCWEQIVNTIEADPDRLPY